ncbi:MAG: aromatic amino acid lyase, partial [Gemmatimonadales bacterium]|nr:aromatic amino acid lyase [Gemmatimonadales bacterium]
MTASLAIDGHSLTLDDVARVARGEVTTVTLAPTGRTALERARRVIEDAIAAGERVYGVTTGFGRLAEVMIPPDARILLQRNVIMSHASGFGEPISREAVRALMLLRANTLAHGHSGCTVRCVELLLDFLNRGI